MNTKKRLENLRVIDKEIDTYGHLIESIERYKYLNLELHKSTLEKIQKANELFLKQAISLETEKEYMLQAIHQLEDERHRKIIYRRYVESVTAEKVAEELYYDVATIYKLTKQAIKELDQMMKNDEI